MGWKPQYPFLPELKSLAIFIDELGNIAPTFVKFVKY